VFPVPHLPRQGFPTRLPVVGVQRHVGKAGPIRDCPRNGRFPGARTSEYTDAFHGTGSLDRVEWTALLSD
jgi:hypothetical protein